MPASPASISALQKRIWAGSIPLEIRLATSDCRTYDLADPYLIRVPRLSYLPTLLPRLHAFFSSSLIDASIPSHSAWFSFQDLPLKWHYPLGLLYDLFSGAVPASMDPLAHEPHAPAAPHTLPWRLTIHYSAFPFEQLILLDADGKVLHDAWINSVKEADAVRNGTARTAMGLSKLDADTLWRGVVENNRDLFNGVYAKLLDPPGLVVRNVPVKVYLPTLAQRGRGVEEEEENEGQDDAQGPAAVRVVQALVPPFTAARAQTTLGSALNEMLPTVFPSKRNPVLARPVLHGAVVPMSAALEELGRAASYTDGFLHIVVVVLG